MSARNCLISYEEEISYIYIYTDKYYNKINH